MAHQIKKNAWTIERLRSFDIEFHEDQRFAGGLFRRPLPPHVNALREELLDTEPRNSSTPALKSWMPNSPGDRLGGMSGVLAAFLSGHDKPPSLADSLKRHLNTKDEAEITVVTGGPVWDESERIRTDRQIDDKVRYPNPTMYLGFPIYNLPDAAATGFLKLPFISSFSAQTLYRLYPQLIAAPSSRFRTAMSLWQEGSIADFSTYLRSEEKGCFPWAIVQFTEKTMDEQDKQEVADYYYQTAYSASISLSLLENLIQTPEKSHSSQLIPPIVCFTFCWPVIKLWLAWTVISKDGRPIHHMMCIWEGGGDEPGIAHKLNIMFHKTMYWGSKILKPQISTHIDIWNRNLSIKRGIDVHSSLFREETAEFKETVSQIEARLRQTKINPPPVKDIITMVIVHQELMNLRRGSKEEEAKRDKMVSKVHSETSQHALRHPSSTGLITVDNWLQPTTLSQLEKGSEKIRTSGKVTSDKSSVEPDKDSAHNSAFEILASVVQDESSANETPRTSNSIGSRFAFTFETPPVFAKGGGRTKVYFPETSGVGKAIDPNKFSPPSPPPEKIDWTTGFTASDRPPKITKSASPTPRSTGSTRVRVPWKDKFIIVKLPSEPTSDNPGGTSTNSAISQESSAIADSKTAVRDAERLSPSSLSVPPRPQSAPPGASLRLSASRTGISSATLPGSSSKPTAIAQPISRNEAGSSENPAVSNFFPSQTRFDAEIFGIPVIKPADTSPNPVFSHIERQEAATQGSSSQKSEIESQGVGNSQELGGENESEE